MRKILIVIVGSILLIFPSSSFANDSMCFNEILETGVISDLPCIGLNPVSKFCKCIIEWNINHPECVVTNDCPDGGACYLDYAECVTDALPLDNFFCKIGETCEVAICNIFEPFMGTSVYKNLGQCIKDKAAAYDVIFPTIGFFGPECGGDYWWCDSEDGVTVSWIEACECIKASGCDASDSPSPCPPE